MRTANTFLILCASIIFVSCAHIKVPNTEVCAVAGVVAAGADCAETQTKKTRSMNMDMFIEWLEPDEKTQRGAALCQSSDDWNKQKTALETACRKLGVGCTYEMKKVIASVTGNIENLQRSSNEKKKSIKK